MKSHLFKYSKILKISIFESEYPVFGRKYLNIWYIQIFITHWNYLLSQIISVDDLCAEPLLHPHWYVLFFALNLLGFFLCLGTIITIKIIPAINIVINRLIILLLIISCLQSLANCTIGTFLLRGCFPLEGFLSFPKG